MQVTEAIKVFLKARSLPSNAGLVARWTPAMETQVNVAPGNGEAVEGKRTTWSDGINSWWNVRMPKNADGREGPPFWKDYDLKFPFEMHADAIGCTGWDWQTPCSRWVAFDFDALTSHAKGVGITDEELERVKLAAEALPYVETRKSTGGSGIHLYVYFDAAGVPTQNHTEHAALARCILGMMSSETGFDFASQIDCCGGVMWLWAKKLTAENEGLKILKPATKEISVAELPSNWRDHIEVVQKKRSKVRVNGISDDKMDAFEALTSSHKMIPLEASHKAQVEELMRTGFTTLWISDQHLLQTHTCALKELMEEHAEELKLIGYFRTSSDGKDKGSPNCFLFPLPKGAWKVYRFGQGVGEDITWEQDGAGWTTCHFNRTPDLAVAAKANGGMIDPDKKGEYIFAEAKEALEAAAGLGQTITLTDGMLEREARLRTAKDGNLTLEVERDEKQDGKKMVGWIAKKDKWVRVFDVKVADGKDTQLAFGEHDHKLREIMSPTKEAAGWVICKDGVWYRENATNVKMSLQHDGLGKPEAESIMGGAVKKSWNLVNLPFREEYPGGRQWNMDAAQLIYQPAILGDEECPSHPHWDMILNHVGSALNEPLRASEWAQRAGIKTGAQYLLCWIANMLKYPFKRLPYLFLFGPENCGKSIFHESLSLLMTKGCVAADRAVINASNFNGELANCVLAHIEEVNVSATKGALERIKDWVVSNSIAIRQMRCDQYTQENTTHWVQCANKREYCPIFKGDTRITVIGVPELLPEQEVRRDLMNDFLIEEAPHFMYSLMNVVLPEPICRLRLPPIETAEKKSAQEVNSDSFPWADENLGVSAEGVPAPERLVKSAVYAAFNTANPGVLSDNAFGTKLAQWADAKGVVLALGKGPKVEGTDFRPNVYMQLSWLNKGEDNRTVAPNADDLEGGQQ